MKLTSLLKGVRSKQKLRLAVLKFSKTVNFQPFTPNLYRYSGVRVSKNILQIGCLAAAILLSTAIVYKTDAMANQSAEASDKTYNLYGSLRTSDQSPVLANVKISKNDQIVYDSVTNSNNFSTSLTGDCQYRVHISQEGFTPVDKDYDLTGDLSLIIDLEKINSPTAPVAVSAPAPNVPDNQVPPQKTTTKSKPKTSSPAPKKSSSAKSPSSVAARTDMSTVGVLDQINIQRKANGLGVVSLNSQLNSAAYAKAKHMSDKNYFAHTAPDGTTDWFFIDQSGYKYSAAGANLAMGDFGNAAGLVNAWMNSPGHKANILASFGRNIGIGMYGKYYVMLITG